MATRQAGLNKPLVLVVTGVFIALVVLYVGGKKLQQFSYNKLAPLTVELALLNKLEQSIIVEYDYGYGFNTGHSQEKRLSVSDQPQLARFTISSWKKVKKLRIRVSDQNQLRLNSVTLQHAGSMVRMLGVPRIESALQIVFQLDNVSDSFEREGSVNASQ